MKNETEFKNLIKKSVRAQKGFSISLAAPMLGGIPDLYVLARGFIPILLEAKWMGELKPGFNRKIKFRPLQKNYIDECNTIKECSAFCIVGFKFDNKISSIMTVHDSICHDRVKVELDHMNFIGDNKLFDISNMFAYAGVPKLNGLHA
jgi:hypothetical protein